jgi:hypothetical protein
VLCAGYISLQVLLILPPAECKKQEGRRNSLNICPGPQHWENIEVDENQEPLSKYPRLCDSPVTPEDIDLEDEEFYPLKVDLASDPEGFNDLDWVMGQSHESGSVYQSIVTARVPQFQTQV